MIPATKGRKQKERSLINFHSTFFILIVFIIAVFTACSQYDSSVGGNIVSGADQGQIAEAILPVTATATQTYGDVYKSSLSLLPLGLQDEIQSDLIFKFDSFNQTVDSVVTLESVEFRIYASGFLDSIAAEDGTEWSATVKRINENLDILELRYDTDLDMTDLGVFAIGTKDTSDSATFQFEHEDMKDWLNDTLDFNLRISPESNSNFIKRFFKQSSSTSSDVQPRLMVRCDFINDDVLYEDSLITVHPSFNTYLVNDEAELGDDRLVLSGSYARRMLFSGDFTQFTGDKVSINRAELVLHVDKDWSRAFGDASFFTWWDLKSEWVESGEVDSAKFNIMSNLAYAVKSDTNIIRINVTPIAKWWIAQPDSNYGVGLRHVIESTAISRLGFYDIVEGDTIDTFEEALATTQPYFYMVFTEFTEP